MHIGKRVLAGASLAIVVLAAAGSALAWSTAQKVDAINGNHADINTPSLDGCPIQSPDGLSLYLASTPARGQGRARHLGRNPLEHKRALERSPESR